MIDTKRSGPPSGAGPGISHHEATDPGQSTAARRLTPGAELPGLPFAYGVDHPDTDLWADRDGRLFHGDGPYLNRPLRRLRRALRLWLR